KTGTSDRDSTPLYNKDGTRKMNKVRKKNADGVYVDAEEPATFTRWDGWFIGIAPLDNSQIAIAVVVEDIGEGKYGGGTAGPIAAAVIKKAAELGLLGEQYKPKTKQEKKKNQRQ
nr:penicillin-binding transpeptidase domain-containing protein [Pyrinomonadaceae bacterium]